MMNKERLEYLINEMCCNFLYQNEAQEVIDYIENLQQRITRAIEYIEKYDIFKEFSFPLMKRDEENQVKSSIEYEFNTSIKKNLLEILGGKE